MLRWFEDHLRSKCSGRDLAVVDFWFGVGVVEADIANLFGLFAKPSPGSAPEFPLTYRETLNPQRRAPSSAGVEKSSVSVKNHGN
jgi:hypothetical protein